MDNKKQTNILAILGLVFSLVYFAIVGLIFSIIGLIDSKRTNSGKGIAIAGIIISSIRILFLSIIVISIFSLIILIPETVVESVNETNKCHNAYACECVSDDDKCECRYYDKQENKELHITCPRSYITTTPYEQA